MHIMIREGTQAKNLSALLPLVRPETIHHFSLVTDDLHPHDILHRGHLDAVVDAAVEQGLDPIAAIRMVTLNTARYFGLQNRGAIAPGYGADMTILSSLHPIRVEAVYKGGKIAYENGKLQADFPAETPPAGMTVMNVKPYSVKAFAIKVAGSRVRVIDLIPDQIITETAVLEAAIRQGEVVQDTNRDILKIAVIERHHATGNISVGLVRGFGLTKGALASSVAHDSHNIICVGASDGDMFAAARAVESMQGGMAVACNGRIAASLDLPIGGLMSPLCIEEIAHRWSALREAARELGCRLGEPFMHLSFLALPVIPQLKITDRGLVDVDRFDFVSLFVQD